MKHSSTTCDACCMHVENSWARFDLSEICGATHIWYKHEAEMPCLCGQNHLVTLGDGTLAPMRYTGSDAPNIAYRFGVMSHFIVSECDCHPARANDGDQTRALLEDVK